MIRVLDVSESTPTPIAEGTRRTILSPKDDGTRVGLATCELNSDSAMEVSTEDRTRVIYVLEGDDANITHESAGKTITHPASRRTGVCLAPGESATIEAAGTPLTLLDVSVPSYSGVEVESESQAGYFFDEGSLRSLVDEKGIRERTFWINTETGLSNSRDLQLGRMRYAPDGYSPRHVHRASDTATVAPEHFYLIEDGTGTVKHDTGSLSVGPGSLVWIPAEEWHQLIASETGLDYVEFQAPFDFSTTMDHDPLGKNWYIKGTDDGIGKPELWVQS
jgi:mannose-6-phosphate isomerase-like protein (cupin superfamily)